MTRVCTFLIALILAMPVSLSAQVDDSTGAFLSLHGCAFWSTSDSHDSFYGGRVQGGVGGGIGYRHSPRLATIVQITYYPAMNGLLPTPLPIDDFRSRYPAPLSMHQIDMWIVNAGVEYRLLAFDALTIEADGGAIIGLSTDRTLGSFVRKKPNTTGVVGLFAGPTVMVHLAGSPLAVFASVHYRYAPAWNAVELDDYSGIPLLIGLRCKLY
jgi:hypothetical protein